MCVSPGFIAHSVLCLFFFLFSHSFCKTLVKTLASRFLYNDPSDTGEEVISPKYRHVVDKLSDDITEMKAILQQLE